MSHLRRILRRCQETRRMPGDSPRKVKVKSSSCGPRSANQQLLRDLENQSSTSSPLSRNPLTWLCGSLYKSMHHYELGKAKMAELVGDVKGVSKCDS